MDLHYIIWTVTEFKDKIDYVNKLVGVCDCDNPVVEVLNETYVTKIYNMKYTTYERECKKISKCEDIIEFNGPIVKFTRHLDYWFDREFDLDKTGYIGWKLGVLQKALDNRIKQQEKVKQRAQKMKNSTGLRDRLRWTLSKAVFGRGTSL